MILIPSRPPHLVPSTTQTRGHPVQSTLPDLNIAVFFLSQRHLPFEQPAKCQPQLWLPKTWSSLGAGWLHWPNVRTDGWRFLLALFLLYSTLQYDYTLLQDECTTPYRVHSFSFPGPTPSCGVFLFQDERVQIITHVRPGKKKTPHTWVDPGKLNERTHR